MATRNSPKRYRKKKPFSPPHQPAAVVPVGNTAVASDTPQNGKKKTASPQNRPGKDRNGGNKGYESAAKKENAFLYLPAEKRSLWPSEFVKSATQPYRLIPRQWRQERLHLFLVFFLIFLLYFFTSPHKVTLEDDGLFIANMEFFGVAHPPGYPIHTFLGGIFYHLIPFGEPAFRGHLFSGFAGAIAGAAIYACIIMLVNGRVFGYLGGLAYGASKTFWSQAIIAEVYTLNAMFFFIVLALCILYASNVGRSGRLHTRLLYIIAFVYGLGMANHYPLLLLGTTGLGLLVLSQLFSNILPNILKTLAILVLGAVPPYLWMVWRSFDSSPANFYGPIESLDQFLFYVNRSGYSGVDTQEGVGIEDKIIFTQQLADDMLWQFTPIGFFFVALGFCALIRSRYNWLWLSLAASWFTSSVLLIFLLDFKAAFIWLAAFRVYHLLAYGIMAIWLAVGAAWLVDKLRAFLPFIVRQQISGLIVLAVVGGSVYAHWDVNNRRDYSWAHDLAMAKISSVEPNAELFLFDDLDLPVGYLHYVEGIRPDLKVYNDQGLVYGLRLYSPLIPDEPIPGNPQALNKVAILREFIDKNPQPIYYHPQRGNLYRHPAYGSDFTGFFRRVNRDGPEDRVILSDLLRQWLNDNVGIGDSISDLWTRQQHYSTIAQLINAIVIAGLYGFELNDAWLEVIDRAREDNTHARLTTNSQYLGAKRMSEEEMRRELAWTYSHDIDSEELLDDGGKSNFFILRAKLVSILSGVEDPEYELALQEALKRFPEKDNRALALLLVFYTERERYCDVVALADSYYPQVDDIPDNLLRYVRQGRRLAEDCPPAPVSEQT